MLADMVKDEKPNVVLVIGLQHFGCFHSFPSVSTKVSTLRDFLYSWALWAVHLEHGGKIKICSKEWKYKCSSSEKLRGKMSLCLSMVSRTQQANNTFNPSVFPLYFMWNCSYFFRLARLNRPVPFTWWGFCYKPWVSGNSRSFVSDEIPISISNMIIQD